MLGPVQQCLVALTKIASQSFRSHDAEVPGLQLFEAGGQQRGRPMRCLQNSSADPFSNARRASMNSILDGPSEGTTTGHRSATAVAETERSHSESLRGAAAPNGVASESETRDDALVRDDAQQRQSLNGEAQVHPDTPAQTLKRKAADDLATPAQATRVRPPSIEETLDKLTSRKKPKKAKVPAREMNTGESHASPAALPIPEGNRSVRPAQMKPHIMTDKRTPNQVLGRTGFPGRGSSKPFRYGDYGGKTQCLAAAEKWLGQHLKAWEASGNSSSAAVPGISDSVS